MSRRSQQAARVNVDDAAWRRFRVLALEADRSIADYLGQLVRDELRRQKRPPSGAVATGSDADDAEAVTTPCAPRPKTRPTRLADVDVLTRLPSRRTNGDP